MLSAPALPLSLAKIGEQIHVTRVGGKAADRHFLGALGFAEGASVFVIAQQGGNVIVNVKGARIAISKALASRIMTH